MQSWEQLVPASRGGQCLGSVTGSSTYVAVVYVGNITAPTF